MSLSSLLILVVVVLAVVLCFRFFGRLAFRLLGLAVVLGILAVLYFYVGVGLDVL